MSNLEQRLRAAATRMPGPYRSDAEESGPSEVSSLLQQMPELGEPAAEILGRFLESGSVDEARLGAYLIGEVAVPTSAAIAGYRRADLPTFERSKLAWAIGRALVDPSVPMPVETGRWAQDRNDGPAFWGAHFLRERAAFERDAPQRLARDAVEAGNQLWFAAALLRDSEFAELLAALRKLEPHFGTGWVTALETTLTAVRQASPSADHALPSRA